MIRKRLAAKTARAGTAVLFAHWKDIKCPIEAYKLVQSFVVDASQQALKYTDASEHVHSYTAKRSGCEAPEISNAALKRQKTEVAAAENDLSGTWSCGACAYVNDKPLAPVCAVCGSNRAGT
jgi:hypothetical protein